MRPLSTKNAVLLLLSLLVAGSVWIYLTRAPRDDAQADPPTAGRISRELTAEVAQLEQREQAARETLWAREILAQECGRTIEALWDELNASTNKLERIAGLGFGELMLPVWTAPKPFRHGIVIRDPSGSVRLQSTPEWRTLIRTFAADGWVLVQSEFRHIQFDVKDNGEPGQSRFYFSAHLTNNLRLARAALEGELRVDWGSKGPEDDVVPLDRIDASRIALKTREGAPPFTELLVERIKPLDNAYSIDPLIVYDLDGDGISEIILAARNLVYRRSGGSYQAGPLCSEAPGLISTAVIADFDGDGSADFMCQRHEGLVLFRGSSTGTFDQPGKLVWPSPAELKYPMVLTCGDLDLDLDLDLFVAQYRVPYELGSMPTPFHDAKDGYPAFLLLNDGNAGFTDQTKQSGLGPKLSRRTYSASLADLDQDGDLDLAVISDFAGVDLYRNDGRGHFSDVTETWVDVPQAFGMAHTLADFNVDGFLDLLMIGMTSPTVDRLEHSQLWRDDNPIEKAMRPRMAAGNRLYLAKPGGGYLQNELSASVARSGWSWGCSAFDMENDGFPDVYIANGLESRESVRDYESEYWLHDRFVGRSEEQSAAYLYFQSKFTRTRGRGQSYGGYEKNRLYLNQDGVSFFECAHLLGVGLENDSRNVVADDVDGDGRVDFLVTGFETWPEPRQTLRVYRNTLAEAGNWIGFQFREEAGGRSAVGAQVVIRSDRKSTVKQIVTGDSYRSQHGPVIHFGLGRSERLDEVKIRWVNGRSLTLENPGINQYHAVSSGSRMSDQR